MTRTAVVTGASSGIGAASARALASDGFHVVCAARREDRIEALAEEIGGRAVVCDVTDAGLGRRARRGGRRAWTCWSTTPAAPSTRPPSRRPTPRTGRRCSTSTRSACVRVTQALLPALRADGGGLVINMGSTAGRVAYEGGGGYTAAKHAVKVITQTLRLELVAEPLRFTEIAPGMVKTEEFTLNRFQGDQERYDKVYEGVAEPLVAEDIAEMRPLGRLAARPREHRRARRTPSGAGRPAQGAPRLSAAQPIARVVEQRAKRAVGRDHWAATRVAPLVEDRAGERGRGVEGLHGEAAGDVRRPPRSATATACRGRRGRGPRP